MADLSDSFNPGYGTTRAHCKICNQPLDKAQARADGEPTYIGYHPCPQHPKAETVYRQQKTGQIVA